MKILIVSDTHRRNENILKLLDRIKPIDMIIHCGDAEGTEYEIYQAAGCPLVAVTGNNDFFSDLPKEREFELGDYKVWMLHGHNYYVTAGNETLKREARGRGVDIVMYGHTHRPVIDIEDDLITINPGSISYPRQEGRQPSYIIMDLDENGEAQFALCYL